MSTYPVQQLLELWKQGRITAEQAVGHLLQNLASLVQRITELEQRVRQLERRGSDQ